MDLVRENEIEASVCQSGTTNPYTIPSLYFFFFVISPLSWASQTSNRNSKQTQFCVRNSNSVSQPEASALPARLERGQKWERAGLATLGGKARHVSESIYLVHPFLPSFLNLPRSSGPSPSRRRQCVVCVRGHHQEEKRLKY